ncbi:phage tail protein, partial [Propionibacterium freudenreichii]|uniref:phage tail protein n=1 Tax=Propionibacterium freudenreichii TaxID=1744 RepID=UPI0038554B71
NFPEVALALRRVEVDIASKVLARTLNRVVEQASTQMSREIRSQYNLPADYVRDRLRIRRAFAGAGQFSLQAELIGGAGQRRSANVIRFVK